MSSAAANLIIQQGGAILSGQKQETTVMMADIRNCKFLIIESEQANHQSCSVNTQLAHLEPSLIVSMLNDYFTQVVKAIQDENGILDKYSGDAAMAIFGLPCTSEDDAIRAIRAAMRLNRNIDSLNSENRKKGRLCLQIGLGLSTSTVLSGNIGSISRFEYTIVGDNVSGATALDGIAKAFGVMIVVDEKTRSKAANCFDFRELDTIQVT
jgi:adenylate cyclase